MSHDTWASSNQYATNITAKSIANFFINNLLIDEATV
ncbi:Uncharacterised protein [Aeromonas hydrophila]|nr:Uncharacterised protein [Aeromonas hydrophila]